MIHLEAAEKLLSAELDEVQKFNKTLQSQHTDVCLPLLEQQHGSCYGFSMPHRSIGYFYYILLRFFF